MCNEKKSPEVVSSFSSFIEAKKQKLYYVLRISHGPDLFIVTLLLIDKLHKLQKLSLKLEKSKLNYRYSLWMCCSVNCFIIFVKFF